MNISCINQISSPHIKFQSCLAPDHSVLLAALLSEGEWKMLWTNLPTTHWWVWSLCSPCVEALALQRRYLSVPFALGLLTHHCNDLASVSLNHNISNSIVMNSRPHSAAPQLKRTGHLWISICLQWLYFLSLFLSPSAFFPFIMKRKRSEMTIWLFKRQWNVEHVNHLLFKFYLSAVSNIPHRTTLPSFKLQRKFFFSYTSAVLQDMTWKNPE